MENSGGFRRGEPENVCEQPGRTESERAGKNMAYSDGSRLQTPGTKQQAAGLTGNGKDVADTQSKRNRGLPVQPGRSQQEDTDIKRSCENVQYPDGPGRKEQHISGKSNEQRFSSGGGNAGDIRHPTGPGLPDGTGVPLGGYGTPEPEPQRSGSDVSDTDYGSGAVWRNGKLSEIEKAGAGGCDFGGGVEKHESGQRRPTQPGLDGVVDGISDWLDEALNYLEENAGDFVADDDYLEWYWNDFLINHYWDVEPDIPRVASGVPNRVDRLKALGNAVVPQQFYPVFRVIAEIERKERVGK